MVRSPDSTVAPDAPSAARRLAAIVFTDVVGYSRIVHKSEVLGQQLLDRQARVVRGFVPRYGGREIRMAGDGFLLEFSSALSAVQAVIAIQTRLANDNLHTEHPVTLRASVHLGDVDHVGGDVFGDGVNIAARLMPLSPEGGIAISGTVRAQVRQQLALELRSIGTPELKNIEAPVEVFVADADAVQALGTVLDVGSRTQEAPPPQRKRWPLALAGGLVLAAVAVGLALWLWLRPHSTPVPGVPAVPTPTPVAAAAPSIAVLPFTNTSGDAGNDYFSDGLAEELINTLARQRELRVIGRRSSFMFKDATADSRTIGEKLGVNYLLEGSVRKAANRVRISIELVRAADATNVWSTSYDRDLQDIFAVQSEIAAAVSSQLLQSIGSSAVAATSHPERPSNENVDAYQAVLEGKFYTRRNNADDLRKAMALYERAIALDPQYAMAYSGYALAAIPYATSFVGLSPEEKKRVIVNARTAIEKAIGLDPNLPDAYIARGQLLEAVDLDLRPAGAAFRKAEALAPRDAEAVTRLGRWLAAVGRPQDAAALYQRAVTLDPLSRFAHYYLAYFLDAAGNTRGAEVEVRKAIELEPKSAQTWSGLVCFLVKQPGRAAEAVEAAQRELDPFWKTYSFALAYYAAGDRKKADEALDKLIRENSQDAAFQIAEIYAYRKDADKAFQWLDEAWKVQDPGVSTLLWSAFLTAYHDDPRYDAYLRKAGLIILED